MLPIEVQMASVDLILFSCWIDAGFTLDSFMFFEVQLASVNFIFMLDHIYRIYIYNYIILYIYIIVLSCCPSCTLRIEMQITSAGSCRFHSRPILASC